MSEDRGPAPGTDGAATHTSRIRVQPRHCDAQGMVHASRYNEFFEDAVLEWLDVHAGGYHALRESGIDLVITHTDCRYLAPARLGDTLEVRVQPVSVAAASFVIGLVVSTARTTLTEARTTYLVTLAGRRADPPAALRRALGSARDGPPTPAGARKLLARLHDAQRRLYDAGDATAVRAVLHPDVVWVVPGRNAIAGRYEGREAVIGYMLRRRQLANATFTMHPKELLVGDAEHLAFLTEGEAQVGGETRTWSTIGLYRVTDGRVSECRLIPFDQQQFDDIWSAPDATSRADA